jgi:ribosomal protein S18 acetylase RimI-like enzyme
MRRYVEQAYGPWDETWQRAYFERLFQPERCRIVTSDGQDVGLACTVEAEDEVVLNTLEVLPEHQRKGIGTFVLRSVQREAFARGKAVTLQVLKVNPARRLYERLGFTLVDETEKHYQMRGQRKQVGRQPSPAGSQRTIPRRDTGGRDDAQVHT